MAQWLGTEPFLFWALLPRAYYTRGQFYIVLGKIFKEICIYFAMRNIALIYNVIRIDCTAIFIFFEIFSENSAKTGSGIVIYLDTIMTHDDKFADRFIGQSAIRGGLSGVP